MDLATRNDPPTEPLGPTPLRPGDGTSRGTPASSGPGSSELAQAITVLRARIDEEFRITERLDSKSRQAFALTAGFFAVVQTVAFGGFAEATVNAGERLWLGVMAVIAGLCVVHVANRLTDGEELIEEDDVTPEVIVEWCEEAGDDPEYVSAHLVRELSRMARGRADHNAVRASRYDRIASATRLALIFAGAELLTAILVRL